MCFLRLQKMLLMLSNGYVSPSSLSPLCFSQCPFTGDKLTIRNQQLATNASSLPANPSKSFIIAGASAGANIACVAAHVAIDDGLSPAPTGVVLNSPLLCHYEAMPEQYKQHANSWEENKDSMILSQKDVRWLYGMSSLLTSYLICSPSEAVWEHGKKETVGKKCLLTTNQTTTRSTQNHHTPAP